MSFTADLAQFVSSRLQAAADPAKAGPMQAYLKTEMPFYGVATPARALIARDVNARFVPRSQREYAASIRALWRLSHREEKYAALDFACHHRQFITSASLPLYEVLVRDGAWWDLVDTIAIALVSPLYVAERKEVRPMIERWIDDPDLWIRRTALLAHNRHTKQTDYQQLFDHCLRRAGEKEFFIRKAIGWALRQYSYADPPRVQTFLRKNRKHLSPLSFREGARALARQGIEI